MNINILLLVWIGHAVNGQSLAQDRLPDEMLRHSSGGFEPGPSKHKVKEVGEKQNGDVLRNMNAEDNTNIGSTLERENKGDAADIKQPCHHLHHPSSSSLLLSSSALETTFDRRELGGSLDKPFDVKWKQLGLDIFGEHIQEFTKDFFSGYYMFSISADGNVVAIGAPNIGGSYRYPHGLVQIFKFDDSSGWIQMGEDIDGKAAGDHSGFSISLSADGNVVAIGAPYNDGGGISSGHVRIFKFDDSSGWIQMGKDIDGEAAGDHSGSSVSLSADGNVVAIGAPGNDGGGNQSGHVRIFKFDDDISGWIQMGEDIDGQVAEELSGWTVSLFPDGNVVKVGWRHSESFRLYSLESEGK